MNNLELLKSIKENPYKIAQDVGFKDVRKYPHNDWMQEIINGHDDYTLMAHRGSYKSSCLSVCIALIMILFPRDNIIFLRKADNDVSEMIRMVKKALESNIIKSIASVIYGNIEPFELKTIESTQSSITTNLFNSVSGASQLLGIGLKSSITGKHANIVITDDICNINDRVSQAEREKTNLQYQELQNIRNRGGRIINLGTKWHEDDVFTLMENIHTYDYKQTGLIDEEKANILRQRMTPSLFACNYELKIVADDDVIFPNPQTGADASLVLQGTSHVDAAFYGEDYTAFTILAIHDGKYYVYGKCWRKHIDSVMGEIVGLHNQFNCGKLYNERNADKGYVAKELRKYGIRVVSYDEHQNKFIKIVSYLKFVWKDVIFVEGTDPDYIKQIEGFNENAPHDDCPDSLSSLIRIMGGKSATTDYKPMWN